MAGCLARYNLLGAVCLNSMTKLSSRIVRRRASGCHDDAGWYRRRQAEVIRCGHPVDEHSHLVAPPDRVDDPGCSRQPPADLSGGSHAVRPIEPRGRCVAAVPAARAAAELCRWRRGCRGRESRRAVQTWPGGALAMRAATVCLRSSIRIFCTHISDRTPECPSSEIGT